MLLTVAEIETTRTTSTKALSNTEMDLASTVCESNIDDILYCLLLKEQQVDRRFVPTSIPLRLSFVTSFFNI